MTLWPEHANDHPTIYLAERSGTTTYLCKRADCDWRAVTKPGAQPAPNESGDAS